MAKSDPSAIDPALVKVIEALAQLAARRAMAAEAVAATPVPSLEEFSGSAPESNRRAAPATSRRVKSLAAFRQVDVTRAIKAAEAAGWPRGSFKVMIETSGAITILPINTADDEATDIGRRIDAMVR